MGKRLDDKKEIVAEIQKAAEQYKEKLVGRRFLYVFDGRYIEVIYKKQNFRHLTGVDTDLSAERFYSYAIKGKLQASQIYFSAQHPYALCRRKIKHINEIASLAGSESFMLEEIKTLHQAYKFGTTDLNFSVCLNREKDSSGQEKGDCYIAESLRDEDCFSKSEQIHEITHIFSKANDAKYYTDLIFMDRAASLDDLPEAVSEMLADELT